MGGWGGVGWGGVWGGVGWGGVGWGKNDPMMKVLLGIPLSWWAPFRAYPHHICFFEIPRKIPGFRLGNYLYCRYGCLCVCGCVRVPFSPWIKQRDATYLGSVTCLQCGLRLP